MSLADFNGLVAEVADWINRDDATSTLCQTFIQLTETDMKRRLRARVNEKQVTITVDTTNTTYTIPSDLMEIKELNNSLSDAPPIERISLQDFKRFGAVDSGSTAWPVYFARDYDKLVFYPITGSNDLVLTYWAAPVALSSSNTTNDILTNVPDLYLFGALAQSEMFFRFDADQVRFGPLYEAALARENDAAKRQEYAGSTLTMGNPYG